MNKYVLTLFFATCLTAIAHAQGKLDVTLVAESDKNMNITHITSSVIARLDNNVHIFAADVRNNGVMHFALDSNTLTQKPDIGQTGSGPGDYRSIKHLFMHEDKLSAYDDVLKRITTYEINDLNEPKSIINLDSPGSMLNPHEIIRFVEDTLWIRSNPMYSLYPNKEEPKRAVISKYLTEGEIVEPKLFERKANERLVVREKGGMALNPDFTLGMKSIFRSYDGSICYSWTEDDTIDCYSPSGVKQKSISLSLPRKKVTEQDLKIALSREAKIMGEPKRAIRDEFSSLAPDYLPYITNFLLDEQGRFYVAESAHLDEESRNWHIYSTDGVHVGTFTLPIHFNAHHINENMMVGELLTEKFASYLQIYRIDDGN